VFVFREGHGLPLGSRAVTGRRVTHPPVGRGKVRADAPRPSSAVGIFASGVLVGLATVVVDGRFFGAQRGRRGAPAAAHDSPAAIPARGWKEILKRTWSQFNTDHIPAVAGGATFFGLLALFPALGVFVSLYGLFADVEQARLHILTLRGMLPDGVISVLSEQMRRLAAVPHARLGVTFVTSLLLSMWSSNAGMKALIAGLNVAYEEKERRSFLRLNLLSLSFTAGGILLAVAAAGLPGLIDRIGLRGSPLAEFLQWPVLLAGVVGVLSVLYRYAPCRAHARWRWITPGSAFAALAWLAMSMLFTLYVANFGHYDKTYGSLGAVVGFMTWIWLSLAVVLLGAELNSELEQQTSADTTTGPPAPAGRRGAAVADKSRRPKG
jgi:membrane protein